MPTFDPMPALPAKDEEDWYAKRAGFDAAVTSRLQNIYSAFDSLDTVDASGKAGLYPTIRINTTGLVPVTSKDVYLPATFTIVDPSAAGVVSGTLQIKGRGNYTWGLPKKPYRLQFDTAIKPLGMTATQKNWALLANHDDPRKTGYSLGLWLTDQLNQGLDWVPEFRRVEVILNNAFIGFYLLTDLWRIEAGRVPAPKATGTTGDALTGTWLAEISRRYEGEGDPGFTTSRGVMIQFDDPGVALDDADPVKAAQAAYFRDHIQTFENALYAPTFADPGIGYAKYVDMRSFATWYLVCEFASSQDSNFESSIKLWKERDNTGTIGKLHMGVWDTSIAFGLVINYAHNPEEWYTINPTGGAHWIRRMNADPAFRAMLQTVWGELKAKVPDLLDLLVTQIDEQDGAVTRDNRRWGNNSYYASETFLFTKDWILRRVAWMDANLASLPQDGVTLDTTPPSMPGSVTVTTKSASSITVAWTAATDNIGVTGYRYQVNSATPVEVGMTLIQAIPDLLPLTSYTIGVAARDSAGNWGAYRTITESTLEEDLGIDPVTAYDTEVLADNPALYYPMHESGAPIYNYVDATIPVANPVQPGVALGDQLAAGAGRSVRFDGSFDKGWKVNMPAYMVGTSTFTIEFLFKANHDQTSAGGYKGIAAWPDFRIMIDGDNNMNAGIPTGGGSVEGRGHPIRDGQPHHVALVYTGTELRWYFDGKAYNVIPAADWDIPAGEVQIGAALGQFSFAGDLAGWALNPAALSAERINAHAIAAGVGGFVPDLTAHGTAVLADNPLFYMPLDDKNYPPRELGSTTVAIEPQWGQWPRIKSPALGPYTSSTQFSPPGGIGRINVPKPAELSGASGLTFEAIVRMQDGQGGTPISRWGSWNVRINAGGVLEFFTWGDPGAGGGFVNCSGTTVLAAGTAYHIAGVYNGTDLRVYVNGTLEGTTPRTGSFDLSGTDGFAVGQGGNNMTDMGYSGQSAGVALWATALTAAQIDAHATAAGF